MASLDARAERNLAGVHPDLVRIVRRAREISSVAFTVTEGVRTLERQRQLVAKGASQTLRSRHIPGANGMAHAIDVAALVGGTVRWDWPLYDRISIAFKQAARELNLPIEWGGDWRSFKDGPHYQLPWAQYPG
jgi:peptidoglycan L-alanyl-D-glutamate endopeptidase CwlK